MISFDKFLQKEYHPQRYNCWHFACEVWAGVVDKPYDAKQADSLYALTLDQLHELALKMTGSFITLPRPKSPCFILMRRQRIPPHVGIYLNDKVLHLSDRGAFYDSLDHATACFTEVSYHAPK